MANQRSNLDRLLEQAARKYFLAPAMLIVATSLLFPSLVFAKTATTTTLSCSPNPSTYDATVTCTATVSPSAATGTVTFKDGSTTLGTGTLSSGKATYSTATLAAGSHSLTAVYGGDTNYNGSTSSAFTQTVNKASTTTTLSCSPNPSTYGASVTCTATVSPSAATGTVTFKDGSTTLGTGTLSSGKATYSTATLAAGSHSLTAVYGGDTNYSGSTSSAFTQTVNKASTTTTVTSSLNPSTYGASVTFTATVTPSGATGTVTFKNGSTTLGTGTLSGGKATYATSTLAVGSHSITAVYGGDSDHSGSTSSALTQIVKNASSVAVTSSLNPSTYGASVTLTATVTPSAATGTVQFQDGGVNLGSAITLSGGKATYSTSTLAVGSHSITAVYSGDSNYMGSTSPVLTQTVNKASTTTTVTSSLNPSTYGASVTFTAAVTPSGATGTVTFKDGSTTLGTGTLSGGKTTYSTSGLTAGSHFITAVYGGDSDHSGSTSSALTQTVNKATPTINLSSSLDPSGYGIPVTFSAVMPGSATGIVTFLDGGGAIGTGVLSGGTATYITSSLPEGANIMTASYPGDNNFNPVVSAALTQTVNKASTTTAVTSSLNPSNYGVSVTFTATVTPSGATGTVQFQDGGVNLGSAVTLSGGQATYSTSTLATGTHSITAVYSGDSNHTGSTSPVLTQTVTGPSISGISPTSGVYGAVVTISGQNFGTATGTVTLNNVALLLLTGYGGWSNTTIYVYIPTGATSGPIKVTTSTGGSAQSSTFTVNGPCCH